MRRQHQRPDRILGTGGGPARGTSKNYVVDRIASRSANGAVPRLKSRAHREKTGRKHCYGPLGFVQTRSSRDALTSMRDERELATFSQRSCRRTSLSVRWHRSLSAIDECLRTAVGPVDRNRTQVRLAFVGPDIVFDRHGRLGSSGHEGDGGDAIECQAVADSRRGRPCQRSHVSSTQDALASRSRRWMAGVARRDSGPHRHLSQRAGGVDLWFSAGRRRWPVREVDGGDN